MVFGKESSDSDFGSYKSFRFADSRQAFLLENAIEPEVRESVYQFFLGRGYSLTDSDRDDTDHVRHLVHYFTEVECRENIIIKTLLDYAQSFLISQNLNPGELIRAYANFNLFGDFQFAHTDGDNEWTALFFINDEWKPDWGGELLLYDESADLSLSIPPKPGRLAIFDGLILHRGGVPSKHCFQPRISFALKFSKNPTPK